MSVLTWGNFCYKYFVLVFAALYCSLKYIQYKPINRNEPPNILGIYIQITNKFSGKGLWHDQRPK